MKTVEPMTGGEIFTWFYTNVEDSYFPSYVCRLNLLSWPAEDWSATFGPGNAYRSCATE